MVEIPWNIVEIIRDLKPKLRKTKDNKFRYYYDDGHGLNIIEGMGSSPYEAFSNFARNYMGESNA